MWSIEVKWLDQKYIFPYRVYSSVDKSQINTIVDIESLGLLSRHHDGFVRQIAIQRLLLLYPLESVPYVVQLLSEYVIEISETISRSITREYTAILRKFLSENPLYKHQVYSRITSYWDCYYRSRFGSYKEVPSFKLLFY